MALMIKAGKSLTVFLLIPILIGFIKTFSRTFANLLARMSDLRELSDVHSDHQVRFANQDLHKLYQEIDSEPRPHVNMDLNNTSQFLSAMEFSIQKTHHTLPKPEPVSDPTYRSLEQIEEMCADIADQQNSTETMMETESSVDEELSSTKL